MRITIAICTWNRAHALRDLLEGIAALGVPHDVRMHVLVVNNACTDDTDAVVQSMHERVPLTLVHEPDPGLSRARNRAVAHAACDYIIWLDDDAIVDTGWLGAFAAAFARHPDAAFFGGPIVPRFTAPTPVWLERGWSEVAVHYGLRTCDPTETRVTRDYTPFGGNLALRFDVQRRHRYDPRLGRRGALLNGGEECAVLEAILADGGTGWWVPDARIEHRVDRDRMTLRHLRDLLIQEGVALSAQHGRWQHALRAVRSEAAYRVARMILPAEVWLPHFRRASLARGLWRGSRT